MRKTACIALAALALLPANSWSGQAPYFPYEKIDSYFGQPPASPSEPVPSAPEPAAPVKAPPRAVQPIVIPQAPDFLFPAELGFGVAVGVPYDLMYISNTYYYLRGSAWYRSSSYRGPWTLISISQLPPELRKPGLAKIRELRNREFALYWKDKEHYRGKHYRPGLDIKEPPIERKKANPVKQGLGAGD